MSKGILGLGRPKKSLVEIHGPALDRAGQETEQRRPTKMQSPSQAARLPGLPGAGLRASYRVPSLSLLLRVACGE